MKTIFNLALISIFLLGISCEKESVTDTTTELAATTVKANKPRPVKNSYVGVDRPDGTGSDFSGNMSHAGKITGQTFTTFFEFTSPSTGIQRSDDVIVAANGDKIYTFSEVYITFSQESIDDGSYSSGTYTGGFDIDGGTGRFAGAVGREDIIGHGVFGSGIATHNAEGWIAY